MGKRLAAFTGYALFWLFFFYTARLIFILSQLREASGFNAGILAATFTHGIMLDISATAYLFIIPFLLAVPALFIDGSWYRIFLRFYTWFFITAASVIVAGDAVLYRYWGFRMDYTPLLYLKTPADAAASATTFELIMVPAMIILMSVFFIYLYHKFIDRLFLNPGKVRYKIPALLLSLILLGALLIPIRGGIGIAPINAGSVYFNENQFINHTAINVFWNVGHSFFTREPVKNPYSYENADSARLTTERLLADSGMPDEVLNNKKPNVLIIVLESFGSSMISPLGGDSLTTPVFNSLSGEGILFTHIYASGPRTDKAMPAILNGYPAQPATSIMKDPSKTQSLPGIVKTLVAAGYSSSFWYGGDINFANFRSFVINSGFRSIITKNDFDPVNYNSKWGVHDNILFKALADSMKNEKEPFVKVVLTLSSHEPFEVPMEPVFQGSDDSVKFRNSIFYTDRSLGDFLSVARRQEWWKNTLVVLVADHCRRNGAAEPAYSEQIFRIPMLWIGGAVAKKGLRIEKYGSQNDIPATLLPQLGKKISFPFGRDLLSDRTNSFAFYTYNEGFCFVTDTSACIYDHKMGTPVLERGSHPESAEAYGKAFLQVVYDDYLKR